MEGINIFWASKETQVSYKAADENAAFKLAYLNFLWLIQLTFE